MFTLKNNYTLNNGSIIKKYNIFFFLLFLNIVFSIFGGIAYRIVSPLFAQIFKIPFILMFSFCIYWFISKIIFKGKMIIFFETGFTVLFLLLALCIGFIENPFSKAMITHIYSAFIIIVGIPFGFYLAKNYDKYSNYINKKMKKIIWISFVLNFILILIYFILVQRRIISYFGISTNLVFITAYFLLIKRYDIFFLCCILALLTGKRVVLIMIFFQSIIYFYIIFKRKISIKHILLVFFLILSLILLIVYSSQSNLGLLRRFELIMNTDFSSERSLYVSSAGRYQDLISAIQNLNKNKYHWITGGGVGEKYKIASMDDENIFRSTHYSHFSPITYTMIFGIIFTFFLYGSLLKTFIKGLSCSNSYYFLVFVALFIGSFSGANIVVDPFFWIFYGAVKYIVYTKRKDRYLTISF